MDIIVQMLAVSVVLLLALGLAYMAQEKAENKRDREIEDAKRARRDFLIAALRNEAEGRDAAWQEYLQTAHLPRPVDGKEHPMVKYYKELFFYNRQQTVLKGCSDIYVKQFEGLLLKAPEKPAA